MIQGDVWATEDSRDSLFPGVALGLRPKSSIYAGFHRLSTRNRWRNDTLSDQLLQVLRSEEEQHFGNIVPEDESWFFSEKSVTSGW
jgi:hypothetical protein